MSRALSQVSMRELFARQSTDAALLLLVRITHELAPGGQLRFVLNNEPVTSNGLTYAPMFFDVQFGDLEDTGGTEVTLTFDNGDSSQTKWLRQATTAPTVAVEAVLSSQPDVVEFSVYDMELRGVGIDDSMVQGQLVNEGVLNQRFPSNAYDPEHYPALFA